MVAKHKNQSPVSAETSGINERPKFFRFVKNLGIGGFAAANMFLPNSSPALASEITPYVVTNDEQQPETEVFVSMNETLTVATWNTFFGNMPENVRDSVLRLLRQKRIDVIGLQEVHNPETRKLLADSINCVLCDYAGYVEQSDFEGSSKASLPLIWNKDRFDLESHGVRKVSDRVTGIDDSTGENMSVSEKNITYYVLFDKDTGVRTRYLVTQTVASVEFGGDVTEENNVRIKLYKQHIKEIKALVRDLNQKDNMPTVIIGDQNVDANYDNGTIGYHPKAVAAEMGFVFADDKLSPTDRKIGTHESPENGEKRWIDHVLVSNDGKYKPGEAYVYDNKMGSDHRPLVSKLRVVDEHEQPVDPDRENIGASEREVAQWAMASVKAIIDRRNSDIHAKRPTSRGHA